MTKHKCEQFTVGELDAIEAQNRKNIEYMIKEGIMNPPTIKKPRNRNKILTEKEFREKHFNEDGSICMGPHHSRRSSK
jgi:hypothetical protein